MKLQVTLTVSEVKLLIAKVIANLPNIKQTIKNGKLVIKGGTTTSAISEEITGRPLWICGRVSPRGTKGSKDDLMEYGPHSILIYKGEITNLDDDALFEKTLLEMGSEDILITGANAIDQYGGAAMMIGSPFGSSPGKLLPTLSGEGVNVIIAAGLEKLIPGRIDVAIKAAGRKTVDLSMGMAVGLVPVTGKLITEKDAVELFADVHTTIIGMGGIFGAEGGTTMVVEGEEAEVMRVLELVKSIKWSNVSGIEKSLIECERGSIGCKDELGCAYRKFGNSFFNG